MKEIKLTKGYVAQVDDQDFERVNAFKWWVESSHGRPSAIRVYRVLGKRRKINLQRFILGMGDSTDIIIFRDRDLLNCQRANLMVGEKSNGRQHSAKLKNTYSVYTGVTWDKHAGKWKAAITVPRKNGGVGKPRHLGNFDDEIAAALAYNKAAMKRLGGIFANLNTVDESMLKPVTQDAVKNRKGVSVYRGVTRSNQYSCWVAELRHGGKRVLYRTFRTEREAAIAYNAAAKKYHKKKAKLNIID